MADEKEKSTKSKDILQTAKDRYKLAVEAEAEIRKEALDDLEFRAGNQWPEDVRRDRELNNRPCLVINRVPQFVRQVTNDQRQNRPAINVFPVDDKGDVETARILKGLIRHIEYNSNADVAYDTAFEGAVIKGFGYFRVITDYVSPTSFNQEILIKRIRDHFSVHLDPASKEPDGSDANWAFIEEDIPVDDYRAEYGESKLSKMSDWDNLGPSSQGWINKDTCKIVEYFYREFKEVEIVLLSDGSVVAKKELPEILPQDLTVVNERKAVVPVIKWCKLNGVEVLEETEWLGKWIPIIPVYGDELFVNGKRILEGVIRHAKDSQRMYNYWASTETETIALAPKAPWVIAEGQIKGYEGIWALANQKSHAFLPYKPTSNNGTPVPPPQRNAYEAPVQAITNARMQASEDLKATTGIYDAALGARSNETSGVAIRGRQAQAQTSNFHLIDNLTRSIRHLGRILVDLIPKVYDTAQAAVIMGEDGEQEIVRINQFFEEHGKQKIFALGAGKYDVTVETGPSYATKRQEALASMIDLTRSYPQVAQVAGDLMVKNMDWPGAQEIAERLKKTLPPNLIDDPNKPEVPPEVQAQMAQMGQMLDALNAQLTEAQETIKTKTLELQSKERIAMAGYEVDLLKEQMKAAPNEAFQAILGEIAHINTRMEMLGINQPVGTVMPPQMPPQDFNFNGAGPEQAALQMNQQPTGGLTPGPFME